VAKACTDGSVRLCALIAVHAACLQVALGKPMAARRAGARHEGPEDGARGDVEERVEPREVLEDAVRSLALVPDVLQDEPNVLHGPGVCMIAVGGTGRHFCAFLQSMSRRPLTFPTKTPTQTPTPARTCTGDVSSPMAMAASAVGAAKPRCIVMPMYLRRPSRE
jgi:hypothetical protein